MVSLGKVGGKIAKRLEDEDEAIESGGFVMVKMKGMILGLAVIIFIGGLERKSGMTLSFPLMCEISKENWENHAASLRSCAFTALLGLNLIIPFDAAKSVSTRKWCPIKWNSNFMIPCFIARSSLKVE